MTPDTTPRGHFASTRDDWATPHATPRARQRVRQSAATGNNRTARAASAGREPRGRPSSASRGGGGARGVAEALLLAQQRGSSASLHHGSIYGQQQHPSISPYASKHSPYAHDDGGASEAGEPMRASFPASDGAGVLEAIAAAVGEAPDAEWARASVRGRLSALAPGMARQASLMPELLRATLLLGMLGSGDGVPGSADADGEHAEWQSGGPGAPEHDDTTDREGDHLHGHRGQRQRADGADASSGAASGATWMSALRAIAPLLHADAVLVYAAAPPAPAEAQSGLAPPYAHARSGSGSGYGSHGLHSPRPGPFHGPLSLHASWTKGGRALGSAAAVATTIARRTLESGQTVLIDGLRPNSLFAGCALSVALPAANGEPGGPPCGVLQALRWRGGSHDSSGAPQFVYPQDAPAVAAILAAALVPAVSRYAALAASGGSHGHAGAHHGSGGAAGGAGYNYDYLAPQRADGSGTARRPPLPPRPGAHGHAQLAAQQQRAAAAAEEEARRLDLQLHAAQLGGAGGAGGAHHLLRPYAVGERVFCEWKGQGVWYSGAIHAVGGLSSAIGNGSVDGSGGHGGRGWPGADVSALCYDVSYDDGAFESAVPIARLRREADAVPEPPPPPAAAAAPATPLPAVAQVSPGSVRRRGGPLEAAASRAAREAGAAAAAEQVAAVRSSLGEEVGKSVSASVGRLSEALGSEVQALTDKIAQLEAKAEAEAREAAAERKALSEAAQRAAERADAAVRAAEELAAASRAAAPQQAQQAQPAEMPLQFQMIQLQMQQAQIQAQTAQLVQQAQAQAQADALQAMVTQSIERALGGSGAAGRGVRSAYANRSAGRGAEDERSDDGAEAARRATPHAQRQAQQRQPHEYMPLSSARSHGGPLLVRAPQSRTHCLARCACLAAPLCGPSPRAPDVATRPCAHPLPPRALPAPAVRERRARHARADARAARQAARAPLRARDARGGAGQGQGADDHGAACRQSRARGALPRPAGERR